MTKNNNVRKVDFSEKTKTDYNVLGKKQPNSLTKMGVVIIAIVVAVGAAFMVVDGGVDRGGIAVKPSSPQLVQTSQGIKRVKLENPFSEIKQELDVDTAYKLTNVQRVTFDPAMSSIDEPAKDYLGELFSVTDFLVVERMQNHNQLTQMHRLKNPENYTKAIMYLEGMQVPSELSEVHGLILAAVKEQAAYFDLMNKTQAPFNPMNPYVQTSNQKLVTAYQLLLKMYGREPAHNLRSFEEHLCALDFI